MGRIPSADFQAWDSHGVRIWSQRRGQIILGVLRLFSLDAGKGLSFRHTWNQLADSGSQVPPGEYLIRGVLLTDDPSGIASPPARLRIDA